MHIQEVLSEMKLKMGMVGGGEGSFIGPVHRIAAELDGKIELVAGAFSSNPERSRRSGTNMYGLAPDRCYASYNDMFEQELALDSESRIDFVAIVTPNHLHFPVASAALESGFHVVCDKPATLNLQQAIELKERIDKAGRLFALTHNYTGYPMIREAKHLVQTGALGRVRRINAEYIQGWLADLEEKTKNKQAQWRTDPNRAGAAGCMGDIGTHAFQLTEFVTGLRIEQVSADLTTFAPGRKLDDDGNVLLKLSNNAKGVLCASQVAVGVENGLTLRVYGEEGGVEWSQMEPNSLTVRWKDRPYEVRRTGGAGVHQPSTNATRLPAGHPEGFLEAFALLYRNFAESVVQVNDGADMSKCVQDFPSIEDGVRGMQFIDAVVNSSEQGSQWTKIDS